MRRTMPSRSLRLPAAAGLAAGGLVAGACVSGILGKVIELVERDDRATNEGGAA